MKFTEILIGIAFLTIIAFSIWFLTKNGKGLDDYDE
jgi:hypothetical protein